MKLKHILYTGLLRMQVVLLVFSLFSGSLVSPQPASAAPQQQEGTSGAVKPIVVYPDYFAISQTISELDPDPIKESLKFPPSGPAPSAPSAPAAGAASQAMIEAATEAEAGIYEFPLLPLPKGETEGAAPDRAQSGLQVEGGMSAPSINAVQTNNIPAPLLTFEGLSSQDNFNAFGSRVYPPDTNGDVGPNHYVQMTNLLVRVWDKAGNPLTPPFKLSSLFTPLGGQCAAPDAGDPIVLYDPLADRWLLSQFAFLSSSSPPYHQCIAISQTSDPAGAYYLYDFITPGNEFPDYPKLGVWPDAYYMTTNQFLNGGSFDGAGAFAFDRTKMLAGDPTAGLIYFNLNLASHPEAIGGMLPSDLDGATPPPTGRPNTFAYFLATEYGDAIDGLRLFDFHADFANPLNSTFIERPESPVPVAAFNPLSPSGRQDIQQPPPATNTNALDSISDRLMHRLQYRNFGSYESLVTNHTVNVSGSTTIGTYRAGVRYYQLTSPAGGAFSVGEQGTYAPNDGSSRWMASAAVDGNNNLAIGFSVSSLTTYPSIRYAGRMSFDPPGELSQGENSIIEGSGVQLGTAGRWGDYSALSVDPVDDCTFWYTTEYYTAASQASSAVGWLTRIGAFRLGDCTAPQFGTLQGTVTNAFDNTPVSGANIAIESYSASTDASGFYSRALLPGTYTVTASKFGFMPATATVTIVDGATTVQDFSLTPMPVIEAGGSSLLAESFQPGNGALDPAETVTVSFELVNIGPGPSSSLTATLLNSGGVLDSSGSANYGAIAPYSGTASQPFTFRVDPNLACGASLVATLQLEDSGVDLGTVSFSFDLGSQDVALTENFDGVAAPALPAGWTATVAAGLATNNWRTVTTSPDTAPNAVFAPDISSVHDIRLDTPAFTVPGTGALLTFRNYYNTEAGYDGGVLEISINGGAFTDILAAGGSFVSGGYNRTLSSGFSNPLPGRQAWSGDSAGYITTVVNLPDAAAGASVQLRFRLGSDSSVSRTGWWIDSIQISGGFQCAYKIVPVSATIVQESFLPGNGVLDPGEAAVVDFALANQGTASTMDLVATLENSGGVTNSSGAQSYGALPGGSTASQPYTFRVDANLACGASLVATLQLEDSGVDLGAVSFDFTLGTGLYPLVENFDAVSAPALPAGWTATVAAGLATNNWRTATTSSDTAPNAAFVPDPNTVHDIRLDTPAFTVPGAGAQLTFRNSYNTESGFDGGVLEISINGGAFTDILAAGGSFVSGGYNRTLSTSFSNPLPGRQAWSGNSGGYITTVVNLPASAAGANIQLRFRMGSDSSVSGTGWRIDSIQVFGGFQCDSNAAPLVTTAPVTQTVQYSDPIMPVSISASDSSLDLPLTISTEWKASGGSFSPGLPGDLSLTDDGCSTSGSTATCGWTLSGSMQTAPGTYVVRATVSDSQGSSSSTDITITVTQEDARAFYTGSLFVSTSSSSASTANLLLSATIKDISVTADSAGDTAPGDIRNATVTFVNRDNGNAVLCSGPVGLVNAGDLQTGTASCDYTANLGSANSMTLRVGIIVAGYYTRSSTDEDSLVTVSKALGSEFITGGGYLVLSSSAGLKAGDPGTKNNFGFDVKYNRSGRNLQGHVNIIVRRMEADGILHVYQIKGNQMSSLTTNPASGTAVFTGRASIQDITNPDSPVSVDGNATIQLSIDDNGEPGSSDMIGITVFNKSGGVWFSSNWNGTRTIEQLLGGGNLVSR